LDKFLADHALAEQFASENTRFSPMPDFCAKRSHQRRASMRPRHV